MGVQQGFKHVFLYYPSVLLYFFVLLASVAWAWYGEKEMEAGFACDVLEFEYAASKLGQALAVLACAYSMIWYCCDCCAGSVRVEREEYENILEEGQEQGMDGMDVKFSRAPQGAAVW